MNKIAHLSSKLAIILCGPLLGYTAYSQPSVSVGVSVPLPSVDIEIRAESDFYEPLAPQGEWVTSAPTDVAGGPATSLAIGVLIATAIGN